MDDVEKTANMLNDDQKRFIKMLDGNMRFVPLSRRVSVPTRLVSRWNKPNSGFHYALTKFGIAVNKYLRGASNG